MKRLLAVALFAAACSRPAEPSLPPSSATPEPEIADGAPLLQAADPPKKLPDGRVEYHVLVAAVTRTVFVPLRLSSTGGKGESCWSAAHALRWRYDAEKDEFVSSESGSSEDQLVDAVFPGSNQVLSLPVAYEGAPPASETLTLSYRSLTLAAFAARAYPSVRIEEEAKSLRAADARAAIGAHLYDLDAPRRLAAGFFLRDDSPARTATITIGGAP